MKLLKKGDRIRLKGVRTFSGWKGTATVTEDQWLGSKLICFRKDGEPDTPENNCCFACRHEVVLMRDQTAYQEPPTPWLFNDGRQPVGDNELVVVICEDGQIPSLMGNNEFAAKEWDWTLNGCDCDIFGWRPANPPKDFFDGKEIFTTG